MDYHGPKALLNRYLARHVGGDRRPVFLDIDSVYPALNEVTRRYKEIRAELDRIIERSIPLPRYHDIDSGEKAISDTTAHRWNVFLLEILGHKLQANRLLCPETCRALERVPNVVQAFFSILDPGKTIPEHEGPYLGYLRYHLALRVPRVRPPRLKIADQQLVWQEGQAALFDDSWPHAVENDSPEMRAVLIVDVMRPLPLLPSLLNRITLYGIARRFYGRPVARKAEQYKLAAEAKRQTEQGRGGEGKTTGLDRKEQRAKRRAA